jgi:hypothetical protein
MNALRLLGEAAISDVDLGLAQSCASRGGGTMLCQRGKGWGRHRVVPAGRSVAGPKRH